MARNPRSFLLLMLIFAGLAFVGAAQAQDPAPTPQTQQPDNSKPSAPEPNTRKPSDPPAQNTGQDTTGKSKIEKETGTVNDRIFEVMPNYTVENQSSAPPLPSGAKFRLATASVFDWFAYPFNMALAGIDQANNSPKSWGQGWGAYGKRVGENFADNSIGTYMTVAIFPSILHEDPRYYQMAKGSVKRRAWHAANRLFWTRTDSGGHQFNYSELVGNAAATAFSNVYHPAEDRTVSRNLETYGLLIFWDGVSNELKEFWPDIRRKVFHKKNP